MRNGLFVPRDLALNITSNKIPISKFYLLQKPIKQVLRACSYDPACRDVSLTETNISVRSYGIFRPACRDEITM